TAFAKVPVEKIVGIVSVKGSANSHLAILGRAMGIPTIMGAVDIPWAKMDGVATIVDGNRGQIVTNPGVDIHDAYLRQMEEERTLADDLEQLRDKPCITVDNQQVGLWVNTGLRIDALLSIDKGAEGVGLYRTEIPFLMQDRFPSEEEQRKIYREQLEMFAPRIVTMRTLDIGGDKALPYFPIVEANPFLGWRGIRITLDHPEIFLLQVRAMMRASEGLNNLRILLPMISNTEELDESLRLIDQAFNELTREEGVVINKPEVGVMIEVPAAVFQVREFSERVDFLSVGTNDLTQYLLAVDRNNPRVADLYHSYHPALLRALREIAAVANAQGTPVSVCGEMAGDPLGAVILAALGYRVLSMSATSLLRVKAMLSQVSLQDAHKILEESLKLSRPEDVKRYVVDALSDPQTSRLMGASSTA
ncbi:MAG: phosphoenolpyruvate--protein phosphotransferase, partial [bacterium]